MPGKSSSCARSVHLAGFAAVHVRPTSRDNILTELHPMPIEWHEDTDGLAYFGFASVSTSTRHHAVRCMRCAGDKD
jgi:hypothetical protein